MTLLARPVGARPSRLRHLLAWHPEWWVHVVVAAAWVWLVVASQGAPAHVHGAAAAWSAGFAHWVPMVLAMMLPVAAPTARAVGLRSLWSRRQRSVAVFVVAYVAGWLVLGALLLAVLVVLGVQHHGSHLLPLVLLLAAAWQVSAPRRRLLQRCAPLRLGAAAGLAADRDSARAGLRSARQCALECWPTMLAMALSHSLWLMAGLTVVLLSERRRGPNPVARAGRPLEAWVLVGFALVALVVPLLG